MDDGKSGSTGSERGPDRAAAPPRSHSSAPGDPATRLQILSIENATLLALRSQIWGEAASRAAVYLAILSGAVVAIALAAQATAFGQGFVVFALLLLPIVLFSGLVTLGRIAELNNEDLRVVQSLNRLRHGLLELDPGIEPYLAMSPYDDWTGISRAYGAAEEIGSRGEIAHGLRTLPALFSVINSSVAGVLAAFLALETGFIAPIVVGAGVVVFVALFVLQLRFGLGSINAFRLHAVSHFPTPANREGPPDPGA
jgi:hypothetical protein